MLFFRKNKMKYNPRYVIYLAIQKYLKPKEIACLNYDLKHSKIHHTHQFLAIVERYFDIETFRENPCIHQDVGLYYYLKHDAKSTLVKKGYIVQYEKEVILQKGLSFDDVYNGYLILGIC